MPGLQLRHFRAVRAEVVVPSHQGVDASVQGVPILKDCISSLSGVMVHTLTPTVCKTTALWALLKGLGQLANLMEESEYTLLKIQWDMPHGPKSMVHFGPSRSLERRGAMFQELLHLYFTGGRNT